MCVIPRNVSIFTAIFVGAWTFCFSLPTRVVMPCLWCICGHVCSMNTLLERISLVEEGASDAFFAMLAVLRGMYE